ncbi:MAG: hypothetical protein Q9227_001457 [Pyrenula ochraceoflavens]
MSRWSHLIRFIAKETGQVHLGQLDSKAIPDLGLATFKSQDVKARLINGSIFDGIVTDRQLTVSQLLPPIDTRDVPLIRCLGLNYRDHAKEANMPIPSEPVLFIKPRTSLCGPHPQKILIPKLAQDGTSDYEAELTFIIGRDGRDIPEKDAMSYVLGFTCGNDVSARTQQFKNSQWSFSKGFDSAAPVGPVLVSPEALGDPHRLKIQAIHNGNVVQDSTTKEMIFGIEKTISFLSQGTTLERGTVIMTGTPPGIGAMRDPRVVLRHGDDMRVYIEGIGTLINQIEYEP